MTDSKHTLIMTLLTSGFGLLLLAIYLWVKTPDMFLYFNQAFCPH